jgi:NhaP-type Na+/H+ or K+/H+ antiporter
VALNLSPSDPLTVFFALAVLIFLGFLGNLIFSKLRFNDTLILIFVGVVVGPITGLVDQGPMLALSGIVGPLALILILFDGGLALKFRDLAGGLSSAVILGVVSFVATTSILGAITAGTLGIPFIRGAVLGAILGGTSALVVLPSLENMNVEKKTGTVLGLESALTDVLVVVVSFTLISIAAAGVEPGELISGPDSDNNGLMDSWEVEYFGAIEGTTMPGDPVAGGNQTGRAGMDPDGDGRTNLEEMNDGGNPVLADEPISGQAGFDAQSVTSKLLITFSMSIFLGLAAGFAWLLIYPGIREKPFGYMLTLGFMFAMYVFVEWILQDVSQGGGPLAVLAFGIILGNNQSLGSMGGRVGDDFGQTMRRFQGEISFLVRTFFFVFLGIIVDIELLKDFKILGISILLLMGMAVARYIAVVATTRRIVPKGDDMVMMMMMPRGLAAAVLAAVPASMALPHLNHDGIPGTKEFVALAFLVLVWTNLLATVGGLVMEKKGGAKLADIGDAIRKNAGDEPRKRSTKTTAKKSPSKKTARKTAAKKTASKSGRAPSKDGRGRIGGRLGETGGTQSALEDLGRRR